MARTRHAISGRIARGILGAALAAPVAGLATPTFEAGWGHSLAITPDGEVWAWGENAYGELGNNLTINSSFPVRAGTLSGVTAVAGGANLSVALLSNGTVWVWGNPIGITAPQTCQLPNLFGPQPTVVPCARFPVQVAGLTGITAIAAGSAHVLAVRNDGTVRAWGSNTLGQLGDGTQAGRVTPVTVTGLSGVAQVAAGHDFSLALRGDGTVWAWGNNIHGELGTGATSPEMCPTGTDAYNTSAAPPHRCARTPVQVPGLAGVTAISAKGRHAMALLANGTVMTWGSGLYGQIGDGTQNHRLAPFAVPGLTGVAQIAAGFNSSFARRGDGSVFAWGFNGGSSGVAASIVLVPAGTGTCVRGGLTLSCAKSPVAHTALAGATSIVAGGVHVLTLRADGSILGGGANGGGQLGYGPGGASALIIQNLDPFSGLAAGTGGSGGSIGTASNSGGLNLNTLDFGLSFGSVDLGTSSAPRSVRFTNLQNGALGISEVSTTGSFSRTHNCPASLPAFSFCTLDLVFTPTLSAEQAGVLTIRTNAQDNAAATLKLTGVGGGVSAVNYTSLWWNPAESGWGVNLNHQDNLIFATIFTYAADRQPLWLVASDAAEQPDGSYVGTLYRATGPPFNAVPWSAANVLPVGQVTLRFAGASAGTMTYSFNGTTVTKSIQRQVFSSPVPTCTFGTGTRATETNYQDLWWNPAESGWGINLTHQGELLFATLFTYTSAGRDGWFVASDLRRQADGSFTGALYTITGPPFNAVPWGPVAVTQVGTMTLRFASGNAATLTYSVQATQVVKSIVRQVFDNPVPVCR
jgi:alpha-tubulin suppressor-like RCC1 family protein